MCICGTICDKSNRFGLGKLKACLFVGFICIYQTDCQLGLYKLEGENIIINATIAEEDFADSRTRQPSGQLFILEKVSKS